MRKWKMNETWNEFENGNIKWSVKQGDYKLFVL